MKRASFILLLLLLGIAIPASASVADGPDYTILWNRFSAISVIDSFVVGIAPKAIVVSHYDDTLSLFVLTNLVSVDYEPVSFKRQDTLMIVRSSDDRLVFYDLSGLPNLTYLGTIDLRSTFADPHDTFADFVLYGRDLYVSTFFNGIWRFSLNGYGSAQFSDSSMTGILMTQLEISGDTLYALDEYNGILRFDLLGPGFGEFLDYLYIPLRAASFLKTDSLLIILTKTDDVLFGEFGHPGSGIIDSIAGISNPLKMFIADTLFVFLNNRSIDVVDRNDPNQRSTTPISEELIDGDVLVLDNQYHLLLPHIEGGLTLYNLDDLDQTRLASYRPGPINDLLLHNGQLFTGGGDNPIDVYSFEAPLAPELEYTIFDDLRDVRAIEHNGDSLIVFYEKLNKVVFIANSSDPDSLVIEGSFFLKDTATEDIQILSQKVDTVRPLLAIGGTTIDVYAITDSSGVYYAKTWQFVGRIAAVFVQDSLLFVSTNKNQLWLHRITDSLDIEPLSAIDFEGTPAKIMAIAGRLVAFVRNEMIIYDYSDPKFPELVRDIPMALPVMDAVKREDKLYTVGPLGAAIYNLDGAMPDLIEYGGRGGSFLDVEEHILVTSDGGAIDIYRLPFDDEPPPPNPETPLANYALDQNYPNPFNAATTIAYSLSVRSRVKIVVYNLLGQQVQTLIDEEKPSGQFTAHWNGKDYAGSYAASGVYFYRLTAGNYVATKKMVLLK